ncbi:MAG: GNAT family N-acetyltransferase [Eubacteriales bacterium]|nr:GNAT family N-acetyltransferase [Eubacteriales bacterium]
MMEYRKARPDELGKVIDFINLVFSMAHEPHDFKELLPKAYGDGACAMPEHYIAIEDGRIEGLVGLWEGVQHVLGETIKTGVIGSVSAHPYAKGKGHMKACMTMALEDAKAKGIELLSLGGRRQRYEYFGFTQGGLGLHFGLGEDNFRHGMRAVDASPYTFEEIGPFVAQAHALHAAQPVYAERGEADFALICRSWNKKATAILKNGAFAGYLVGKFDEMITEMNLTDEADCEGVLKAWHLAHGSRRVEIAAPVWNKQRVRTLSKVAGSGRSGWIEMFRIENFAKIVRLWLSLKASYARLTDGRFVLETEGERIAIEVKDNVVSVQKTGDAPDAVFSRLQAQDLLLASLRWTDTDALPACVENWFPLPVSMYSADGF